MKRIQKDTAAQRKTYEKLQGMKEGPFTVPYDTELKESWK